MFKFEFRMCLIYIYPHNKVGRPLSDSFRIRRGGEKPS